MKKIIAFFRNLFTTKKKISFLILEANIVYPSGNIFTEESLRSMVKNFNGKRIGKIRSIEKKGRYLHCEFESEVQKEVIEAMICGEGQPIIEFTGKDLWEESADDLHFGLQPFPTSGERFKSLGK